MYSPNLQYYGHLTSLCYNVRCTLKWTYS